MASLVSVRCSSCSGLQYVDEFYDDLYNHDDATQVLVTEPNDTSGIDFSLADHITEPISPDGGTISLPDGSASIFFPPDAIPDEVFVSIALVDEASVPPPTGGFELLGEAYAFSAVDADGNPVTSFGDYFLEITLRYNQEDLDGLDEQSLTINYYDLTAGWMPIPSTVDTVNDIVTGRTNHFTLFGILGNPIPEPTTLLLMGTGLLAILALAWRRRQKK